MIWIVGLICFVFGVVLGAVFATKMQLIEEAINEGFKNVDSE